MQKFNSLANIFLVNLVIIANNKLMSFFLQKIAKKFIFRGEIETKQLGANVKISQLPLQASMSSFVRSELGINTKNTINLGYQVENMRSSRTRLYTFFVT